jgi:pilus assembly protein CpaC
MSKRYWSTKTWQKSAFLPAVLCGVLAATPAVHAQPAPTPVAPEVREKVNDLIEKVLESEVELKVTLRRSKILRMKDDIFRAAVADPDLIEVVAFGSREVEIIGKEAGSTTLTLWLGTEEDARLLSMLVTVTADTSVDDRRRLQYGEFQQMINEMFPNSKIQLIPIANKLIVRGQARDEEEATQIMSVIRRDASLIDPGDAGDGFGGLGFGTETVAQGEAAEPFPDATSLPPATVISMLHVPGVKQVMLKVRIAELKRSALRSLGADFDFAVGDFTLASVLAGGGNILATGTFGEDFFNLTLNFLETNGTAKILAEPNVVVLSGETASFISGGEFAVPTVVGVGGAQAATTSFKAFGTQLQFSPTVLDKDRIRLTVAPTFSTLNAANSVGGIFGTDTRSVTTTVDLREGQVFAIAGLVQEQQRGDVSGIPFLGRIPGLNTILANRSITRDETELLILVTPELVHPLEPECAPQILPGMEVTEPDDHEFFFYGQIEGRNCCHHRGTVWPRYRHRLQFGHSNDCESYRASESYYINGPHGFSN